MQHYDSRYSFVAYAEHRACFIVMLGVIMLSAIMLRGWRL
jgi:hypothetical protein